MAKKSKKYGKPRKIRKVSRPFRSSKGFLTIKRKLPEINMYNTSLQGNYTLTSQTCVTLGTPISNFLNTYDIPFSMNFRLDQLINYTDITNLADQYRIKYVTVKLYFNSNTAAVSGSSSLPVVQYIVDHDDASLAGATVNALREKMGVKFKNFNANRNVVKFSLKPRVAQAVFNNGVSQVYSVPTKSTWINSAYSGVEHYGIKGILTNVMLPATVANVVTTYFKWDVEVTLQAKDIQ